MTGNEFKNALLQKKIRIRGFMQKFSGVCVAENSLMIIHFNVCQETSFALIKCNYKRNF